MDVLKQEVLSELLEEQFALGRQEFTDCVEYFAYDGREKRLEELKEAQRRAQKAARRTYINQRKYAVGGLAQIAGLLEADPGLSRPEHAPLLGRVRRLFAQHGDMFN